MRVWCWVNKTDLIWFYNIIIISVLQLSTNTVSQKTVHILFLA